MPLLSVGKLPGIRTRERCARSSVSSVGPGCGSWGHAVSSAAGCPACGEGAVILPVGHQASLKLSELEVFKTNKNLGRIMEKSARQPKLFSLVLLSPCGNACCSFSFVFPHAVSQHLFGASG